jgi:hypothetical protein
LRENDIIRQHFIKTEKLKLIQSRDVNTQIDSQLAIKIIENSHIICVFGASIGETDERWWNVIGKWLKGDKILIIFAVTGEKDHPTDIQKQREHQLNRVRITNDITEKFIRLSGWSPEEANTHKKKIYIELDNTKIFDFSLPMKPAQKNVL